MILLRLLLGWLLAGILAACLNYLIRPPRQEGD